MNDFILTLNQYMGDANRLFVADFFGYAGLLTLVFGLSIKDDIRSMKLVTIALTFWSFNYLLLGLVGALLASLIGFIRMYFSFKYKGNLYAFYFVIILTILLGVFSFTGIISALPIVASILAIISFQILSGISMRIMLLMGSFIRLAYMILVQNVPGIINEIIMQFILIITIIKIHIQSTEYISIKSRIKELISKKGKSIRPRVDFGRFVIFRDRKKYLSEKFDHVYEESSQALKGGI